MFDSYAPAGSVAAQRRRSSYLSLSGFDNFFSGLDGMEGEAAIHDNFAHWELPHGDQPQNDEHGPLAMAAPAVHHAHHMYAPAPTAEPATRKGCISPDQPVLLLPVTPSGTHNAGRDLLISPKREPNDARKRKTAKQFGKVISTIKSNRAKPAQTYFCQETPSKATRIKGAVYQIGEDRKKWDGRQWRRLCVVQDCCSAARGATDFCIVHGRGELTKTVIGNEEIEVVKASAEDIAAETERLQRKRKSDDFGESAKLNKAIRTMEISSSYSHHHVKAEHAGEPEVATRDDCRCQFVTALGDRCGNTVRPEDPFCYSCWSYMKNSP